LFASLLLFGLCCREFLASIIDDNAGGGSSNYNAVNNNEYELLLIENNKDINFISGLPGKLLLASFFSVFLPLLLLLLVSCFCLLLCLPWSICTLSSS
jgi:hypothetical protein